MRYFAYEEPYIDEQHDGHYDLGDPFIDCNHDGRWDGNTLGGGGNAPRYYDHVADQVGARALVIANGRKTIAMEVVDNEGLFNIYADRIRAKVLADGYRLDSIQVSSTHDESAPDTIGLGGQDSLISGVNEYFADYLVQRSALAIEQAYNNMRPAHIRYAEAQEPSNLRQCWSSYPFIDNQLMPVLQAVGTDGRTIATVASVSQHAETLGFNGGSQVDPGTPYTLDAGEPLGLRRLAVLVPHRARERVRRRRHRDGRVGRQRRDARGPLGAAVARPAAIHRRGPPRRLPHAVRRRPPVRRCAPLGYYNETRQLGQDLAAAVQSALSAGSSWSRSDAIWADTVNICVPVANALFKAAAFAGTFAERPAYLPGCHRLERVPAAPTGQTAGTSIQSQAAAWRIGDAEFIGAPGEVFPFTFFRGPVGPADMNYPAYGMPPWPFPYMHTPWRFFDGLDNDMIGYIFPRGNDAGVPGQHVAKNPTASGTDRFGCGHSDDSEAVNDRAADIVGTALVGILSEHGRPESVAQGRYVLPDGKLSRNPLGTTDTIKCTAPVDTTFAADGPAVGVWEPGRGVIKPAEWMDLLGRPQTTPDRNTRGWIDAGGRRHWLDVFADIAGQPASVTP